MFALWNWSSFVRKGVELALWSWTPEPLSGLKALLTISEQWVVRGCCQSGLGQHAQSRLQSALFGASGPHLPDKCWNELYMPQCVVSQVFLVPLWAPLVIWCFPCMPKPPSAFSPVTLSSLPTTCPTLWNFSSSHCNSSDFTRHRSDQVTLS